MEWKDAGGIPQIRTLPRQPSKGSPLGDGSYGSPGAGILLAMIFLLLVGFILA
jgi:hypothetical protein